MPEAAELKLAPVIPAIVAHPPTVRNRGGPPLYAAAQQREQNERCGVADLRAHS